MKATGVVRRMDDLGRIVIPKEIRKTMKLKEGDALELLIEKDMICFRKYVPENFPEILENIYNAIFTLLNIPCGIYDENNELLMGQNISNNDFRFSFCLGNGETLYLVTKRELTEIQKAQIEGILEMANQMA